jgi:hypothetical protein
MAAPEFSHAAPFQLTHASALHIVKALVITTTGASHQPWDLFRPGEIIGLIFRDDWNPADASLPTFHGTWTVTPGQPGAHVGKFIDISPPASQYGTITYNVMFIPSYV